jgi:hypothetical protein
MKDNLKNGEKDESLQLKNELQVKKEEETLQKSNKNEYYLYFLDKGYFVLVYISNTCITFLRISISLYGIYLVWILLHYFASHLYIRFCVPASITGFIVSPFLTTTPHCQALRWVIYNGANMINNMWIILGSWISTFLIKT